MYIKKGKVSLIIALVFFITPIIIYAQTTSQVTLGIVDLSQFPLIRTFMDVRDSQGFFLSGLSQEDVIVFEDGQQLQPAEVIETRIGAQIVVAYNLGTALSVVDDQGLRRIDYISQALISWIGLEEEQALDTFSLLSTEGVIFSHTENGKAWSTALEEYQPELAVLPTWDVLSSALDVVSDPLPKEGMGRAVIFITPAMPVGNDEIIQSLADRARQSGIRLYIGLIDSSTYFNQEEAQQLQALAAQTGGQFFAFSGFEPLPDLNKMIESSRRIYQLSYSSRVFQGGVHDLEVVIQAPFGDIRSGFGEFSLNLLPPNPFFLSPPAQILRSIAEGVEIDPKNLNPQEETFHILIEFPDTIEREIVRTVLYVNGAFATENIAPPFTEFVLDLTAYEISQQLLLQVEAFDELSLSGISIETPIQIIVQYPDQTLWKVLTQNITVLAVGLSLLAGVILLLLLILAGKLKPARFGESLKIRKRDQDPVRQPILGVETKVKKKLQEKFFRFRKNQPQKGIPWPQGQKKSQPNAYLVRLKEGKDSELGQKYPIDSKEVFIGSNVAQSTFRIEDPAVEDRHARIWQDENGDYRLDDLHSVGGTWVNYLRISSDGTKLSHGDLLHFANLGFRFTLTHPQKLRKIQVTQIREKE